MYKQPKYSENIFSDSLMRKCLIKNKQETLCYFLDVTRKNAGLGNRGISNKQID